MSPSPAAPGRSERGAITPWLLGLCVMLLLLGGISVDLWRSFSARRALGAAADAAALAGASAIDEERYRSIGEIVLEPGRAHERAWASLRAQGDVGYLTGATVTVAGRDVTVVVRGRAEVTLLGLLTHDAFAIETAATARPRDAR